MATTYAEIAQKLATKKGQVEEELKTTTEPTKKATLKLLLQKITAALRKLKDSQKMHPEAEDPMAQMQGQQGQQQMPQQMPMPQQQMAQQQVPQQQMPMPQPGMQPGMPQQMQQGMQQGMQQPMGYAQTGGYLPKFQSSAVRTGADNPSNLTPYEQISMDYGSENYGSDYEATTGRTIEKETDYYDGTLEEEGWVGFPEKTYLKPPKFLTNENVSRNFYQDQTERGKYDDKYYKDYDEAMKIYEENYQGESNDLDWRDLMYDYDDDIGNYFEKIKYDKEGNPKKLVQRKNKAASKLYPFDLKLSKPVAKWKKKKKGGEKYTVYEDTEGYTGKTTGETDYDLPQLPEYFSGGDLDWGSIAKETAKGSGMGFMAAGPYGLLAGLGTGGAEIYNQFMTGEAGEAQTELDETAAKQEEVQKDKYKALTRFIKPAEPTDPFYTASLPRGKSWQSIEGGKVAPNRKTPFYQESNTNLPMYDLAAWNALDNEEENNKKPPLTPAEKQERADKRRGNLSDMLYMIQKYGPVAGNIMMGTGEKDYYPGFYAPQAPLNLDPARNLLGEAGAAFRQAGKYDPRASISAAANARDRGIYNAQNTASPSTALALQNQVTGDHADRLSNIYGDAHNKNAAAKFQEGQGLAGLGQVEAQLAGRENQWMQDAYGRGTTEDANVWNQRALLDALGRQFLQQGVMDISKGAQTDKLMAGKQYNDLIKSGLLGSMFPNYSYDKDNPLGGIGFNDYAKGST